MEVAGRETEPEEMVNPFAPVINPCEVNEPCVAMSPEGEVVALPPTESVPEV